MRAARDGEHRPDDQQQDQEAHDPPIIARFVQPIAL